MKKTVIAISRQVGSGGRTIGRKTAEKLGYACYDRELIAQIAKDSGFTDTEILEMADDSPRKTKLGYMLTEGRDIYGMTLSDHLWQSQIRVIRRLADQGPCVLVGRCADYLLHDRENCLKVFIHAGDDVRKKRLIEVHGDDPKNIDRELKNMDRRRRVHYELYTAQDWGDADNYDLCLDSGRLGIEKCADLIAEAVHRS